MKRLMDILLSSFLVLLLAPLLGGIALLLHLNDPGPVFYRSRRIGYRGIPFDMLKFRTMKVDGDRLLSEEQKREFQRTFKLDRDPRITPIGLILRRSSLDELPQLINVLRGEMSLVGPRPKLPEELHLFGSDAGELLSVRPGVTGLWQLFRSNGNSDETMRRLDLEYIRRQSLLEDLRLLLLTPWVVVTGRNG